MEDVEVLKVYRDKYDSVIHCEGDQIKLSKERAAELSEKGYVKIIPSTSKLETKEEKPKTEKVKKS